MAALKDTETGAEHPVRRRLTVLGREPGCSVVIRSRLVSRQHALIRKRLLGYTIEDLGSTHGTFVNDERLEKPRRLRDGDVIILARVPLRQDKPVPRNQDPGATSVGWGLAPPSAAPDIRRGDARIGAELTFRA